MNWTRVSLIVLLLPIVFVGAAVVWLVNADFTFLKPRVENYVGELVSRDFTIGGAFELEFSDHVTLIAADISLRNSDWSDAGKFMVHIEHLLVEVDLWSLVNGPLIINRIETSGGRLLLQQLADSRRNWDFGKGGSDGEKEREPFILEELSLEDWSIDFTTPQFAKPLSIRDLTIRQIRRPQDDHLESEISAIINDREIEVWVEVGPFENLLRRQAFTYDATARFAGLDISSSGYIDDLAQPARPGMTLHFESADVDELTDLLGLPDFGDGRLQLALELVPRVDSVELSIQGDLAGLRINASGSASELQLLRQATFRLDAEGLRLGRLLGIFGIDHVPDEPFQISGMVARDAENLLIEDLTVTLGSSTLHLDGRVARFPHLDAADLQLSVQGDLAQFREIFQLPAAASGPFKLIGRIQQLPDGADSVQIDVATPQLNFHMAGPLGDPPKYAGTEFVFTGSGSDLRALSSAYGIVDAEAAAYIPLESFEIDGEFSVTNDSFQLTRVRAEVGDAHLQLEGEITRVADFVGSRMALTASGKDLEDLIADAANIDIHASEFELSLSIERLQDRLRISDLRLTGIAESQLKLDVDIGWPLDASSFGEFQFAASAPDASKLPLHHPAFEFSTVPLEVEARGSWRDGRLIFEGVSAQLGNTEFDLRGVFDRPPDLSATDLQLHVDSPDLSALGLFKGERLPAYPFLLSAHFDGTTESYVLDEMSGELGQMKFSGRLELDFKGPRPHADAQLDFSVLDLRDWLADDESARPVSVADDKRLIPDYLLPVAQFGVVDGTAIVSAREVHLESISFTDAFLRVELADGALRVRQLEMSPPRGRFNGALTILPGTDVAEVHFTLAGEDLQLNFLGESEADFAVAPTFDMDIELTGRGNTTRELANTLSGHVKLQSDGGRIRNQSLDFLFADFARELIGRLNPFSKKDTHSEITCAVLGFDIVDGMVRTSPNIVVQSSKINMISEGVIDLDTEIINFNFNTRPRRRLSISAGELIDPYIRVSGTLAEPELSLDGRSSALAGGAAVVTLGLSILAQAAWDRTFKEENPCQAELARAQSQQ